MVAFVVGVIWLMVGLFGFMLLSVHERNNLSFFKFLLFLILVPVPFLFYSMFALLSIMFTGNFTGLHLGG